MNVDLYIHQHPYAAIGALALLFNIALYMPPPDAQSGKTYKWAFGVIHAFALAFPRIASNFLPVGSFWFKVFAGGNGLTNGATESTANSQTKVDGAPPKV